MKNKISAHGVAWHPSRPTSKGATAYHDAIINSSWHIENIDELVKIVHKKIKDGDIVVDFGAGTGGSAVYLLKLLKANFKLWLVDNSASWLGKAYEIFNTNPNVSCFLLELFKDKYAALVETIGKEKADHVLSANTFHLIPNLEETFRGIHRALKSHGTFTFQSGNIIRNNRKKGVLMIDDTVNRVHDIALELIRTNRKFAKYRKGLEKRIKIAYPQRKFVFPNAKPIEYYLKTLKSAGFRNEKVSHKLIRVKYKDWLDFLTVKRLQAGILPEVGDKEPSLKEKQDRNELITMASLSLFKELETQNTFADNRSFIAEWIYVKAEK